MDNHRRYRISALALFFYSHCQAARRKRICVIFQEASLALLNFSIARSVRTER